MGHDGPLLHLADEPGQRSAMDLQSLHKAMLDPNSYPDEEGPISFRETHISRLYFTRRHVYKLKKPIDFGFLNFTTLDRRRFYCTEEVRLNRRFCPGTYLGVVGICRADERILVGGEGEVVEYAVRMNRLDDDRMLDHLLEADAPSLQGEMKRLAMRIADLHSESEVCRVSPGRSDLETVRRNWEENLTQTGPFEGKTLSAEARGLISTYVDRFLLQHRFLLEDRQAKGWVRDGHGDLHAEHICLTDPICIYDCIEFNRRFRVADVAADLAFLLMDLDLRGRRDLAAALLSVYRRALGEGSAPPVLLPFYKSYRAYVRGKVESFLAQDSTASPPVRQMAFDRARRYFNLALGYPCPKVLVLTCGLMGVGKSTLAGELARVLGATLLRSDVLRKEISGLAPSEKRTDPYGKGIYTSEISRQTYGQLLTRSMEALEGGSAVVADASFARETDRMGFRLAAKRAGVPILLLDLHCDEKTALERLDRRQSLGEDASDGRSELFARQAADFQPLAATDDTLLVDTREDVDYNVHLILCTILERAGYRI